MQDETAELVYISELIASGRISVWLLLIGEEEYRFLDGWSRDKKRGSNRYERFPTALLGDVTLWTPADYATYFLPSALSAPDAEGNSPLFTAAAYAKATGIRGKATYSMLRLLEGLALLEETEEKVGRSRGYRVKTTGGLSD